MRGDDHPQGKQTYHNAFISDWKITDKNVAGIVAAGRARWKIENENNNTLKRRGYHLKHNFGHGKQHLSSVLATLSILAFLFHSFLTFCDDVRVHRSEHEKTVSGTVVRPSMRIAGGVRSDVDGGGKGD